MTEDLERQNMLADKLLETLEKIKAAWEALPFDEDQLTDLAKAAGSMAGCLESAWKAFNALPFDEDQLTDLAKATADVAGCLESAGEDA